MLSLGFGPTHVPSTGNLEEKSLAPVTFKIFKAISNIHLLVNMRNSSSQFKRAKSLQDGRVDEEDPLRNFVKAKQKINALFRALIEYNEDCFKFSADCRIADKIEQDIEKLLSEVRLSNVALNLQDIDENW